MMNRTMNMTAAHPVCPVARTANYVYLNAASFFSALRFSFYFSFTRSFPSERQQTS